MKQAELAVSSSPYARRWPDAFFILLLALLLPVMGVLSFDFGITWDEPDHQMYGRLVLDFFTSGGQNTGSYSLYLNYLNGGLFDLICTLFQKITPFLNPYDARHLMTSFWGWGGLLFTGLLARRLFGSWGGVLAVVIMVLSPRYFGHSMNNPKDIPFAATVAFALWAFSLARTQFPYVTWRSALVMIVAVASCLNIRAGGLLLIAYGGLYFILLAAQDRLWKRPRSLAFFACVLGLGCLAALVLGTLFWPWALRNPFVYPLEALRTISKYPWTGTVLFDGEAYQAAELPARYGVQMHAATMPLSLLGGVLLASFFLINRKDWRKYVCLAFAGVFPLAYIAVKGAILYGGIRHTLFIYPALVALAAGGWNRFFVVWHPSWTKCIPAALLVLCLGHGFWFSMKHHPYEALYFNPLAGEYPQAAKKYDHDYWGLSYKDAIDWIHSQQHPGENISVFAPMDFFGGQIVREYVQRFPDIDYRESPEDPRVKYVITLNRFLYPDVINELRADKENVHTVELDDVPLCFAARIRR